MVGVIFNLLASLFQFAHQFLLFVLDALQGQLLLLQLIFVFVC